MSKVSFSSLGLKKLEIPEDKVFTFNDKEISVKLYLPINDKLELIGEIVASTKVYEANPIRNELKLEIFTNLKILEYYTNITFTAKQKEDICKLYDLCETSKLFEKVIALIPEVEYNYIFTNSQLILDDLYTYENSFNGFLEKVGKDYGVEGAKLEEILEKIKDPSVAPFIKQVLEKLG